MAESKSEIKNQLYLMHSHSSNSDLPTIDGSCQNEDDDISKNDCNDSKQIPKKLVSLPPRGTVSKLKNLELPIVNCPERIVLCVDVSNEMETNTFKSRSGSNFEAIKVLKRALKMWLKAKSIIDEKHEFALMILQEEAVWLTDFTSDVDRLMKAIEDIALYECTSFEIGSIFWKLLEKISPPAVEVSTLLPPDFVLRVILIYGRSHCQTTFTHRNVYDQLKKSPYFFMDAFYTHEDPSEQNKCEEIFNTICELDEDGLSYIIEVYRNQTKVYDGLSQLLAHPLQRSIQQNADYKIEIED